jgi:L-ascorbate metabolism protein UlaG (beta-lactamase superfamily)
VANKETTMNRLHAFILAAAAAALAGCANAPASMAPAPATGGVVKVTPLGGFDGEFCAQDRAMVFEDPNGTRVLYDPGRTVMGGSDPRLGKIDIILVTHTHGDHLGNAHMKAIGAGTCAAPDFSVPATPNGNATNIALAKKAKIVTGSDMPSFFAAKLRANGGNPADSILARFGGSVTVGGVKIATVTAMHSNGLDPDYIPGELGKNMKEAGIWGDVGLATGYVVRFSNGLAVYLSGDTGVTADQQTVVRDLYHVQLAVMNIGDGFTTGPVEAAFVINDLVKPATVIVSHANEAGTQGGKPRPGSKTERFIQLSKVPTVVPLSGHMMQFDSNGKCTAGC